MAPQAVYGLLKRPGRISTTSGGLELTEVKLHQSILVECCTLSCNVPTAVMLSKVRFFHDIQCNTVMHRLVAADARFDRLTGVCQYL